MSEQLNKIESFLGLEQGTIEKIVNKEEGVTVNLDGLVLRTPEQEQELTKSIEAKAGESYKSGLEVGEKKAVNKALETLGLSMEKAKTVENLLPTFKETIVKDLNVSPDKKVQELETTISKLQNNYDTLNSEYESFKQKQEENKREAQRRQNLLSSIPDNDNYLIPKDELLLIAERKHSFTYDENNQPWPLDSNGETLKDPKTLRPIPASQFLQEKFLPNYIKKAEGGNGGSDETGGNKPGGYDEFAEEMRKQGINPGSEKFQLEAKKRISEGTLKM